MLQGVKRWDELRNGGENEAATQGEWEYCSSAWRSSRFFLQRPALLDFRPLWLRKPSQHTTTEQCPIRCKAEGQTVRQPLLLWFSSVIIILICKILVSIYLGRCATHGRFNSVWRHIYKKPYTEMYLLKRKAERAGWRIKSTNSWVPNVEVTQGLMIGHSTLRFSS